MNDIRNQVRDLFFSNILGGGFYQSEDEILDDLPKVDIDLPYKGFMLASVRTEDWGSPFRGTSDKRDKDDVWDLFFILRNVFQDVFTYDGCVCHACNYHGKLLCLINFDLDFHTLHNDLHQKAEYAVAVLDEQFDLDVVVSFSRHIDDLMGIRRCFIDTEDVHEYIQVINEDLQVVSYDDLTERNMPQQEFNYIELQSTLRNCLRRFDTDGARLATAELISREFYDTPPTVQIFRFQVYGLVNTLLFVLEDLRSLMGPEEYGKLDVGPRLTEAASLSGILSEVEGIYDQLDEYSQNHDSDSQPKWVPKIREYVDSSYSDVNVTVSSTANHFSMTPSYCTRAFKRYIGVSLFDYIQQRRIDAAKKLLAQNLSLSEVAESVGFSSPLTMNRAFKRYEGISPGKFKNF